MREDEGLEETHAEMQKVDAEGEHRRGSTGEGGAEASRKRGRGNRGGKTGTTYAGCYYNVIPPKRKRHMHMSLAARPFVLSYPGPWYASILSPARLDLMLSEVE